MSRTATFREFTVGALYKATRTNVPFSFHPMSGDKWIYIDEPEIVVMPLQKYSADSIVSGYQLSEQIFCLIGEQKGWLEIESSYRPGSLAIEPLKEGEGR